MIHLLKDGETWLQYALRLAEPRFLQFEVEIFYKSAISEGYTQEAAALYALEECDII